jgi:hypothetical protein
LVSEIEGRATCRPAGHGSHSDATADIDVAKILKAELKCKGVTFEQLIEKLDAVGIRQKELNVRNKLSRRKFSAAFMLVCLSAIGTASFTLG